MLKNREGHHSDDAVKRGGYELRYEKIALCIAAFRVAALWCTKGNIKLNCKITLDTNLLHASFKLLLSSLEIAVSIAVLRLSGKV